MKCPNCNSEVYESNGYCDECGYHLLDATTNELESDFFEEIFSFF